MAFDPAATTRFRYLDLDVDEARGELCCRYALEGAYGQWTFTEVIGVTGGDWSSPAVAEAARWVHLLAGVSYYKAAAPGVVDVGSIALRPGDRAFLESFYVDGLGEYAYRNGLDLTGITIVGGADAGPPAAGDHDVHRALVPFGGGIDSIVAAEHVRRSVDDVALFVASRAGSRFAAIEDAAAAAGLEVRRAERTLDPAILASASHGFRNGHVPVTGILSAIAALVAVLDGRGAVVMANEHSASAGNVRVGGRDINHQWSKSLAFEEGFRERLAAGFAQPPAYFSLLRARSELWVAERFAHLDTYHRVFRSCNRAFHQDPARRLDHWCGRCDKCCFVDLILAPFLPAADLRAVFQPMREPLDDPALLPTFRTLVGLGEGLKPWECVGDVDECRTAAVLAAARDDRAGSQVLSALVAELGDRAPDRVAAERLLRPLGPDLVPDAYTPRDLLV